MEKILTKIMKSLALTERTKLIKGFTRDELLSKISQRMQEIDKELNELSKQKSKLYDEKSDLICSWDRTATINRPNKNHF